MSWAGPLRAVAAVVVLSMTACLSIMEGEAVSKDAKPLPEGERAVLLGRSQWYLMWGADISVRSVDGDLASGAGLRRAEVVPGRHTIVVESFNFIGGMGGSRHYLFVLDLQAGHRYQIRSIRDSNRCEIKISDVSPGQYESTDLWLSCQSVPPGTLPAKPAEAASSQPQAPGFLYLTMQIFGVFSHDGTGSEGSRRIFLRLQSRWPAPASDPFVSCNFVLTLGRDD
jgi:hypothetical protein